MSMWRTVDLTPHRFRFPPLRRGKTGIPTTAIVIVRVKTTPSDDLTCQTQEAFRISDLFPNSRSWAAKEKLSLAKHASLKFAMRTG